MASLTGLKKEAKGNKPVKMPHARYPNKLYGRLRPRRERVRSERVPIRIVVNVATTAEAATIQEIGRGSGVIWVSSFCI